MLAHRFGQGMTMAAKKSAKKVAKKSAKKPAKKVAKKVAKKTAKKVVKAPAKKVAKKVKKTIRKVPALTKLEKMIYERMVQLDLLAAGADLTEDIPAPKKAKKAKKK